MSRLFPPLTPKQVCKVLEALGFLVANKRGDYPIYKDPEARIVQVNMGEKDFGITIMKISINTSGHTAEKFYGATKETARKIGIKHKE